MPLSAREPRAERNVVAHLVSGHSMTLHACPFSAHIVARRPRRLRQTAWTALPTHRAGQAWNWGLQLRQSLPPKNYRSPTSMS